MGPGTNKINALEIKMKALGIDQNMALFSLDQLACIEAVRIDEGPPFSALLTL